MTTASDADLGGDRALAAAPQEDWLSVHLEHYGCSVVLRLVGELDVATCPLLQECLDSVLAARRDPLVRRLVVDGSGLRFVDASGLSPLLHARAVLAKRGGRLELPDPSPSLQLVLDVLGIAADGSAPRGGAPDVAAR